MGKPSVDYEAGQVAYPFEAMTVAGATASASFKPWSMVSGKEPVIAPYGLLTGGAITPNTETDDSVTVAALTASMAGVATSDTEGNISVLSSNVTVTRGTLADPYSITSITVDSTGALAAVAGTEGTAFIETRGVAGGPPFIPVGSIEIGQVRLTSETAANVTTTEIFTVPNTHVEMSMFPVYQVDTGRGQVTFSSDLPLIHTGPEPKKVYVEGYEPVFSPLAYVANWVPSETSYSVTSEDTYDGPIGAESSSLGQASFTALGLQDGITDAVVRVKGSALWFRFRPDRDKSTPYQLTQGRLGVSRAFPASGGSFNASCTISASSESLDVQS